MKIVNLVGDGTIESPVKPDLPEGVSYTIIKKYDGGTALVELDSKEEKILELESIIETLIIDSLEGTSNV